MGVWACGRNGVSACPGLDDGPPNPLGPKSHHIGPISPISPIHSQRVCAASYVTAWLYRYVFAPTRPYADTPHAPPELLLFAICMPPRYSRPLSCSRSPRETTETKRWNKTTRVFLPPVHIPRNRLIRDEFHPHRRTCSSQLYPLVQEPSRGPMNTYP